ncbi:MAG: ABC transporter ATP-binding protein [Candidatus Methanomethylophilaceae archaeon]|nr:ABC transporter ATP-binding protein [Candidatus Methanomethylophilaceae archaeon]
MELFRLENVTYTHNPSLPPVLENVSLSVGENVRTAVLGANGAGKTTLFYTLTGIYKPQSGEVLFKGQPVEYTKEGLRSLRSEVAVVLQNPDEQIFCSLVEEDVAFGPLNLGLDRPEVEARVAKALRDVRMTEYAGRPLQQLSGGQRKRVAIAGALAMRPKIMIMDEPTAGLDPQASMEVMELAEKLHLSGVTVMISTHDIDMIYRWAQSSIVMRHGAVEFSGDLDSFFEDREGVNRCGLQTPSVYYMNRGMSIAKGVEERPCPRNCCEFEAKYGKVRDVGTLKCIVSSEEDAASAFDDIKASHPRMPVGVYGCDVRYALRGSPVEYRYDAIDACFTQTLMGNDCALIVDPVYRTMVEAQAERMRAMGAEVSLEMVQ